MISMRCHFTMVYGLVHKHKFYYNIIGCQNYLKAVDSIIWTAALRQTEDPPPFFSQAFYCRCQQLVSSYFGWDI